MTEPTIAVDGTDPVPPYEQVRRQIAGHIDAGLLPEGAKLAPVRQLAGDLGVAAGTVARAYRELEQAGYLTTARRAGTVVAARPSGAATPPAAADVRAAATAYAAVCRASGVPLAQAGALLEEAWLA